LSIQPSGYQEVDAKLCSEDEKPEEPIVQEVKGRPTKASIAKRFKN
jgi:hypothetical protein